MKLNKAVSMRLTELMNERFLNKYRLFTRTGIAKATITNIISCKYESVNLRVIHEICQGLDIELAEFFNSPLFDNENLDP